MNEPTNDKKNEKNDDPNKIVTKPLEKAKDYLLDSGKDKKGEGKVKKAKKRKKRSKKTEIYELFQKTNVQYVMRKKNIY